MGYGLEWRLVGRANQLLDSGTFDGDYADRPSALEALDSLFLTFPLRGCNEAEDYWWARRSSDADLEVQFTLSEPWSPAEQDVPRSWMRSQARRSTSLRA